MIVTIFLLIIGALLIVLGSISYADRIVIKNDFIKTEGEITNFFDSVDGEDRIMNITYFDEDGYQYWHKVSTEERRFVGEKIIIHYNPKDHNHSIIYDEWSYNIRPIISMTAGTIMCLIGIFIIFKHSMDYLSFSF